MEGAFLCKDCGYSLEAFAPSCFVCEKRSPDGFVCDNCEPKTRLRRFVAPLRYQNDLARELIHTFKFNGAKEIGAILARYIADSAKLYNILPPENSIFIPIPLHKKRFRERGFNQAELIADELARIFGRRAETGILTRTIFREHQTKMKNREARLKNAEGVYSLKSEVPEGTILILVDDVSTTGATIEEAANVLKDAGAKQVWAFVVAR